MTRRQIEAAVPFWRSVLRLEDWTIEARTGKASEMVLDGGDNDGLNYFSPEEMKSQILLRRGANEEVFIHEMLHLVFDGDHPQKRYNVLHERALNRTAAALMRLKRMTTGEVAK